MLVNLRELRRQRGLTQAELAQRADVHQTTISDIEIGGVKNPTLDVARRIAKALDVSVDELFPDVEPENARV